MKPGIDLISVFTKVNAEDGSEFYSGTMNPSVFKKGKEDVEVVLMPADSAPSSIMDLMKKSGIQNPDLLMFGTVREGEKRAKGKATQ